MAGRHASQENGKGLGGWGRAWFCGSVFAQPAFGLGSGGPAAPTVKPVQLVRLGIPGGWMCQGLGWACLGRAERRCG